jgi:hypothetical protein
VITPALFRIEEDLPSIRGRRSPNLKGAGYHRSVAACFECCRRGARAQPGLLKIAKPADIPPDRNRPLRQDAECAAVVDVGALGGDSAAVTAASPKLSLLIRPASSYCSTARSSPATARFSADTDREQCSESGPCHSSSRQLCRDPSVTLGVLSLVIWTLILVTTIKYVTVAMRVCEPDSPR